MDPIRKMTDGLTKDGDKAVERVQEASDSAWERSRDTWKDLRGQGQQAMAQTQKSAKAVWDDAQKLLRKHPGKAVGLAVAFGAAIGAFLTIRKKD